MAKTRAKLSQPSTYAKAVGAAVTTLAGTVVEALLDGHIDGGEWGLIAAAAVAVVTVVFGVENKNAE